MANNIMRFTDFIKQNIGSTHLEIAAYFENEIERGARLCRIDWATTKGKILWDGEKNRRPKVHGLEKSDEGRSFVWAEVREYTQDKESFTYPFLSFKCMQNSYGQPVFNFNPLRLLYDKYEAYKSSNILPPKKTLIDEAALLAQQEQAKQEADELLNRQIKVQQQEPVLFSNMLTLSTPGVFSPYLQNDKHLQQVAEQFDIRIGKNKHGYFTCFALYNIHNELKSLQRIYHTPPSHWDDNKGCTWGVDTTGLFAVFGELRDTTSIVYLCEGLATALAMFLATGKTVIVCINAYNLPFVSAEIAQHYPNTKRVHVADNDKSKPDFGNTGVHAAALSVQQSGGWVFVPQPSKGNDACDVYNVDGINELRRQIYNSPEQYFNGRFSAHVCGMFNYLQPAHNFVQVAR
jgi:hypothetical protein